jgi:hypothetical protein
MFLRMGEETFALFVSQFVPEMWLLEEFSGKFIQTCGKER